mgnify:CR=1 FL=1
MLILDNIPTEPGKSIYIDNFICRYITNFKFDQEDPYLLNQINEKKKEKTTKVVRKSTNMYRDLANLCEKRKKYSRNMP